MEKSRPHRDSSIHNASRRSCFSSGAHFVADSVCASRRSHPPRLSCGNIVGPARFPIYPHRSSQRQCKRESAHSTTIRYDYGRGYTRKRACCGPPWVIHGIYSPVPAPYTCSYASFALSLCSFSPIPSSFPPAFTFSFFALSPFIPLPNAAFRPRSAIRGERAVGEDVFYARGYWLFYSGTLPRDTRAPRIFYKTGK